MRYITRMDYARTLGWWVRIYARSAVVASKLFSDAKSGNADKALVAAKRWRNQQEKLFAEAISETRTPKGQRKHRTDSRSVSRFIGVAPCVCWRGKRPYVQAWRCAWPTPKGQRYTRFSVAELGYEQAFRAAIAKRGQETGSALPEDLPVPTERTILNRLIAKHKTVA